MTKTKEYEFMNEQPRKKRLVQNDESSKRFSFYVMHRFVKRIKYDVIFLNNVK